MHGSTAVILRDYVDESHPRTLCTFSLPILSILDPHHVVALDTASTATNTPTAVIELPSGRVFDIGVAGDVAAVDGDLSQALWFSLSSPPTLHDSWNGGDHVIQVYPTVNGMCGLGPTPGAFSRDATYGFATWSQGPDDSFLNIVAASTHTGVFVISPPTEGWQSFQAPGMALWNPTQDQLFWTQSGGIQTWTPTGGMHLLRSSLTWQYPTMSPDGTHIAYVLTDNSGNGTIYLFDPTTGTSSSKIGTGTIPMFLTKNWLWVKNNAGGCGPQDPTSYIYDLSDHTTTASSLDWVYATWPATSSLGG